MQEIVKNVPSSFVKKKIKLEKDTGNGEGKFHLGSVQNEEDYRQFFNGYASKNIYTFDKENLLEYMQQVKLEYVYQRVNKYKEVDLEYWEQKFTYIKKLRDKDLTFDLERFKDKSRYYIRSVDSKSLGYNLFREISLPILTDLVIKRIDKEETVTFLFLLQVNYSLDESNMNKDTQVIDSVEVGKNIIYYGAPGTGKSYGVSEEIKEVYPNFNDEGSDDSSFVFRTTFHPGKNIIYYGAPGTGKSYGVSEEIKEVYPNFNDEGSDDSSFVFRTTFHPEYTYTDFVGQVMPQVKEGVVKYEFSPGIFTQALTKAMDSKQEGRPVFLVLEELSRANVAAVFGDLFQLLDRHNGRSEYSITNSLIAKEVYRDSGADRKIYIPNNLHIYGTVNTNDQNVFVMDTAFKRRFEWKYVSTKPVSDENNPLIKIKGLEGSDSDVDWHKFYQRLNKFITTDMALGEDKQVGQFFIKFTDNDEENRNQLDSDVDWHKFYQRLNKFITTDMALGEDKQVGQFFIKFTDNDEENRNQLQNKLLQYLWDDVQGASFNGVKLFDPSISTFSELYDKFGQNQKVFSDDFLKQLFPYKRTVEEVSSDEV